MLWQLHLETGRTHSRSKSFSANSALHVRAFYQPALILCVLSILIALPDVSFAQEQCEFKIFYGKRIQETFGSLLDCRSEEQYEHIEKDDIWKINWNFCGLIIGKGENAIDVDNDLIRLFRSSTTLSKEDQVFRAVADEFDYFDSVALRRSLSKRKICEFGASGDYLPAGFRDIRRFVVYANQAVLDEVKKEIFAPTRNSVESIMEQFQFGHHLSEKQLNFLGTCISKDTRQLQYFANKYSQSFEERKILSYLLKACIERLGRNTAKECKQVRSDSSNPGEMDQSACAPALPNKQVIVQERRETPVYQRDFSVINQTIADYLKESSQQLMNGVAMGINDYSRWYIEMRRIEDESDQQIAIAKKITVSFVENGLALLVPEGAPIFAFLTELISPWIITEENDKSLLLREVAQINNLKDHFRQQVNLFVKDILKNPQNGGMVSNLDYANNLFRAALESDTELDTQHVPPIVVDYFKRFGFLPHTGHNAELIRDRTLYLLILSHYHYLLKEGLWEHQWATRDLNRLPQRLLPVLALLEAVMQREQTPLERSCAIEKVIAEWGLANRQIRVGLVQWPRSECRNGNYYKGSMSAADESTIGSVPIARLADY